LYNALQSKEVLTKRLHISDVPTELSILRPWRDVLWMGVAALEVPPLWLLLYSLPAPVLCQPAQSLLLVYVIVNKINYLRKSHGWEEWWDLVCPTHLLFIPLQRVETFCPSTHIKLKCYLKKGYHSVAECVVTALCGDTAEPTHTCSHFISKS
jgi:hypothetical protein